MHISKLRASRLTAATLAAAGMVTVMATATGTAAAATTTATTTTTTTGAASPATVSAASLSWPSGNITWRNAGSNQFLESQGDTWTPSSWYNVNTGPDETCAPSGSCFYGTDADQWVDPALGGGVYYEIWAHTLTTKPNVTTADACLDSNSNSSTWGSGTGSVYVIPCNQGNYQKWHEAADSYGWRLWSNQTGLCLDGGSGPNGTGIYTYTCQAAGSDSLQRWH